MRVVFKAIESSRFVPNWQFMMISKNLTVYEMTKFMTNLKLQSMTISKLWLTSQWLILANTTSCNSWLFGKFLGEILSGNFLEAKWLEVNQDKTWRVIWSKLRTLFKGELLLGICIAISKILKEFTMI